MSIAPGFTDEEVRAFVYEYERLPQGTKQKWLDKHGIGRNRIRKWRSTVFEGDLDRGLTPRVGRSITPSSHRRRIALDHAQIESDNEQLRARVRNLEATNEALGKAIGLLHQLSEQEPETPETTEPPTS